MILRVITRVCTQHTSIAKIYTRSVSQVKYEKDKHKMLSWQIHSYGKLDELQLSQHTRIPCISNPDDVLVKVQASSVNPIDVEMIGGFGSTALNLMRKMDDIEFPLTLGRDFSGTVVSKGLSSRNTISVGARVWGVVPVHEQGCHAEYVIVNRKLVAPMPDLLTMQEGASVLYAGLTAYSGLRWSANLNMKDMSGLRALVLGASGGVGTSAVQQLKAGNAKVTATCASDAVPLVNSLGADLVLDYTEPNFEQVIVDNGRYDLILDCAGLGTDYAASKDWDFRNYVTFTTPVLKNLDTLGLIRGSITSATDLLCPNIRALKKGRIVKWAYFTPSEDGIKHLSDLINTKKLRPVIDEIFQFSDASAAYDKLQKGHLRGKIVVDMAGK